MAEEWNTLGANPGQCALVVGATFPAELSKVVFTCTGSEANDWRRLSAERGACLHLYGKRDAREGRKMGHVTRIAPKA